MSSLWSLLAKGQADADAIGAPGRPWLPYATLRAQAAETVAALNALGIGRGDRVAIVMPNGPEMATGFLGVASAAAAAPLNPAYRADEFAFYLEDLKPKALLVRAGDDTPALAVAAGLGIPAITLTPRDGEEAGRYALSTEALRGAAPALRGGPAEGEDVALVLHTSGTTARPKIVPLTNANLAASAGHIGAALALAPGDVCLNVMPLFHIHGLVAAILSSLGAGAAVSCTPGFNALKMFGWLGEVDPTWYTAVPTMHQAILARAGRRGERSGQGRLRFVRSSSASLPPQVMAELEAAFGCPVIESYGMTEAAHQMTSNPLPPRARKPGSVGIAAGPEVGILDEAGRLLPQGEVGEVVIRGPNVTPGYEANPDANRRAFTEGWFRTGDQGRLDAEGYLFLTGRLKEIINRGGEKISPLEIDTVLMDHPAVAQVVTFAIPHPKLGEEVGAVVVLRDGIEASERDIRGFAAERLADFKVPRRVLFVDEIPKGATGKMQRVGLAEKLGLTAEAAA